MKKYELLKAVVIMLCNVVIDKGLAKRFANILDVKNDDSGNYPIYYVKAPMQLKAGAVIETDYQFPRGQLSFVREIKTDQEIESDESDFLTQIINEKEPEQEPEPPALIVDSIEADDFSHLPESDGDDVETIQTDENTSDTKRDKKRR